MVGPHRQQRPVPLLHSRCSHAAPAGAGAVGLLSVKKRRLTKLPVPAGPRRSSRIRGTRRSAVVAPSAELAFFRERQPVRERAVPPARPPRHRPQPQHWTLLSEVLAAAATREGGEGSATLRQNGGASCDLSYLVRHWDVDVKAQAAPRWPEDELPSISSRPNTAVCFSGGGSRAFTAALAELAALSDLGLVQNIRHVAAISGGAWALSVWMYYQPGSTPEAARSDAELLGEGMCAQPEDLTVDRLSAMPHRAARALVTRRSMLEETIRELQAGAGVRTPHSALTKERRDSAIRERIVESEKAEANGDGSEAPRTKTGSEHGSSNSSSDSADGGWVRNLALPFFRPRCGWLRRLNIPFYPQTPTKAWQTALGRVLFEPVGVPTEALFCWDEQHAKDIRDRNPSLRDAALVFPRVAGRPFPVIGVTALGPLQLVPLRPLRGRAYFMLQVTPLYTGVPRSQNIRFVSSRYVGSRRQLRRRIGGLVESFAFGGREAPLDVPETPQSEGVVRVPMTGQCFSAAAAAAASSWAPGGLLASIAGRRFNRRLGMSVPYWSPLDTSRTVTDMLIADGGCLDNPSIISMLQRRPKRLVVFGNFQCPLSPREVWNPFERPPTANDISEDLPAFFGVVFDSAGWCFARNKVFATEDFPRVIDALQKSQATGAGAVATVRLKTVANSWWGIQGGHEVEVTWMYLARCPEWEARLPADVRARLANPSDPELRGFPHFPTTDLFLTATQVNLLNQLVLWTVRRHADQFSRALSRDGGAEGAEAAAAAETGKAPAAAAAAGASAAAPADRGAPWVREGLGWGSGNAPAAAAASVANGGAPGASAADAAEAQQLEQEPEQLVLPRGPDSSPLFEGLESGMGGPWPGGADGLTSAWRELDALSVASTRDGRDGEEGAGSGAEASGNGNMAGGGGLEDSRRRVHSRLRAAELGARSGEAGGSRDGDGDTGGGSGAAPRQSGLEEALAQAMFEGTPEGRTVDGPISSAAARRRGGGASGAAGWGAFGLGGGGASSPDAVEQRAGSNANGNGDGSGNGAHGGSDDAGGGAGEGGAPPSDADGGGSGPVGSVRGLVNRLWKAVRATANR